MREPNFIGVGVMKAATTWLWHQLQAHPQVQMPNQKELHYFDELQVTPEQYLTRFKGIPRNKVTGEITPAYLQVPHAPIIAASVCPDSQILVMLRNPVDRAFSHWKVAMWAQGKIPLGTPFIKAFEYGHPWGPNWLSIKERGLYVKYLKRWFDEFDRDQIKIMWHDDVANNPTGLLKELYGTLRVDDKFLSKHYTRKFNENWSGQDPPFKPEYRKKVLDFYLPSIEKLEKLTGKNLSHWKQ